MFPSRDIEFPKNMRFSHLSLDMSVFLEIQYLVKKTFFRAENFRVFQLQVGLSVGEISGRNTVIRFVGVYRDIG